MTNQEDYTKGCSYKVLDMVRILHERGHERLRIMPGMSPSGMYWRCSITHAGNIRADHGAKVIDFDVDSVHYTSGAGELYFDWDDSTGDTPEDLADKFLYRFRELAELSMGVDPEYVRWYVEMLEFAREGAFPVAYSDWYDESNSPLLPTTSGRICGLPMPPVCR